MKSVVLAIFLLIAADAYAAKASAVVTGTNSVPGQVQVTVSVSENTGLLTFSTSFVVNFTSSPNQINTDIKQRVRDELIRLGITITTNDIFLFGGAQ